MNRTVKVWRCWRLMILWWPRRFWQYPRAGFCEWWMVWFAEVGPLSLWWIPRRMPRSVRRLLRGRTHDAMPGETT